MRATIERIVITLAICVLIRPSVLAYTHEGFTDLDSLIKRSKFIVVASIASGGQDKDETGTAYRDGFVNYEISVVHNLKGSLPLGRHPVILHSPFIRRYHNFRSGGTALLFLTDEYVIAGKKMLTNYANTGSIMPASPDLDVGKLKGLSEKQQILFILKDYVEFKEGELKEVKADISRIASSSNPAAATKGGERSEELDDPSP